MKGLLIFLCLISLWGFAQRNAFEGKWSVKEILGSNPDSLNRQSDSLVSGDLSETHWKNKFLLEFCQNYSVLIWNLDPQNSTNKPLVLGNYELDSEFSACITLSQFNFLYQISISLADDLLYVSFKKDATRSFAFERSTDTLEFNEPWQNSNRPIIIDAYHLNSIDWDIMTSDSQVVGVIHKATQGTKADTALISRRQKAQEKQILFGTYHLGMAGDPIEQANFYLETIGDYSNELIALDLEEVENPKFMNLENALIFIDHIYEETNRWPLLYCNRNVMNQIIESYGDTSHFSNCPLWYARFRSDIPDFNPTTWRTYALWQFSSEINCQETGNCLYNVPGTAFDMDVNVFNGTKEELMISWPYLYK